MIIIMLIMIIVTVYIEHTIVITLITIIINRDLNQACCHDGME